LELGAGRHANGQKDRHAQSHSRRARWPWVLNAAIFIGQKSAESAQKRQKISMSCRMTILGWKPKTSFGNGIALTHHDYLAGLVF
jgi:hypothetical protein